MKNAQGRAQNTPMRRDPLGYDPDGIEDATQYADSEEFDPSASDALWHLIAARHFPNDTVVRLAVIRKDLRGGVVPDGLGWFLKAHSLEPITDSPEARKILAEAVADTMSRLNAQGRLVVMERLRKVGHDLAALGIDVSLPQVAA